MASRAKAQRADEDALDPVEAADVEHADDPDEGLLELEPDEDEVEADEDEVEPDDLDELDDDDVTVADGSEADPDSAEDGDGAPVVVLPDAAFDDDDEIVIVEVDDDDDDDEVEGVRDGEFVCRSCYMAKRETQLADPERLLCRDCA